MKTISLLFFLLSTSSYANLYDSEKVILGALFKATGYADKEVDSMFDKKTANNDSSKPATKHVVEKKKELTPGQKLIEKMKNKNRSKIKQLHTEKKANEEASSGDTIADWKRQVQNTRNNQRKQISETRAKWRDQIAKTYARWKEKKKEYKKDLPTYKENLVNFEVENPVTEILLKQSIKQNPKVNFHIIPNTLRIPIKGQGRRPTCASFAGVRAIETVLANENGKIEDLSEQYFYWSSKPECQTNLCSKKGSWIEKGLRLSKGGGRPNIPKESACPYNFMQVSGNETQIPLRSGCQNGIVQIDSYERLSSMDEIISALDRNYPVVGGFKLSPNFYKNDGLITYADRYKKGKKDAHSAGHAILIVGYIQLPKKQQRKEGKVCFITANSWGEGWGKGGYSCITEEWIKSFRVKNAFISINSVNI